MFDRLPDMAAKRAELSPDATAFVSAATGKLWSYRAVNAAADRFAHGLTALGLRPGDRLAVLTQNCVEFFIALFACQKTGVIMAPLNWRQPVLELIEVTQNLGLSAVLYDDANQGVGHSLAQTLSVPSIGVEDDLATTHSFHSFGQTDGAGFSGMIDAGRAWYLLFTSGTTGQPKAVIQTARMCWANALNIGQAIDLTSRDHSVNFLPLFHTAGINLYTLPVFLFGGCSTVLAKFEADKILELLRRHEISQFFGVPAIFQELSLQSEVDTVDWTKVRMGCGGAPLPEPLIHFFAQRGAQICNGCGMTETGPTVFLMDGPNAVSKIGSVGKAQMLTEVRLHGVQDGAPGAGEILLRGPAITPGYFQNQKATADSFTAEGWLKTGDVGQRDKDGYYYIVDRIKDMYISGGENVYPAEVERILNNHPAIQEAAVIGVPDAKWGEVGAAFMIVRSGQAVDFTELSLWLRDRLAAYKLPKSFKTCTDFPRTAAGKIRKPALRESLQ